MNFINNIDAILAGSGWIFDRFPQLPYLIYPPVGSPINLQYVQVIPPGDFQADRAVVAGVNPIGMRTVKSFGENTGRCGFSHPAGTGQHIGMGYPAALQGVLQGLDHMGLADELLKYLGAPFAGQDLIAHEIVLCRGNRTVSRLPGKVLVTGLLNPSADILKRQTLHHRKWILSDR
ncbi:hypothetical protein ES703_69160 [subsurface metagenome]